MNVLSLFDGCAMAYQALKNLNITVDNYFASEIDKYAIKVAMKNHPDIIQLGNITAVNQNFPKIDLLIGGSPCQDLSAAGKQKGLKGERSGLFYEYVRLLHQVKPKYFILENVASMSKSNRDIITASIGVEPIMINSSLVSAQNRKRLYWTNIKGVEQPEDKGIMLKDILETGVVDRDKSYCLDANYFKGGNLKSYFDKGRRQLVFSKDGLCHVGDADIKGNDSVKRVYSAEGKAPTLTTMGGGHREPKILIEPFALTERRTEEAKEIRKKVRAETGKDFSPRRCKELTAREDGKMNCLTATYSIKEHTVIDESLEWRKLTPLECERLQTLPDNYTEGVSNTQRYKMIGNGFTVAVIEHIMKELINEN